MSENRGACDERDLAAVERCEIERARGSVHVNDPALAQMPQKESKAKVILRRMISSAWAESKVK